MAKTLTERFASALGPNARAVDVAALIEIIDRELETARAEQAEQHAIAVDVRSDDATADAAADAEAKAARRITRLAGQRDQLADRLDQLTDAERRRANEERRAEIIAERDQLAADLATEWPLLQAKVLQFMWRITASDQRCKGVCSSAEAVARGVPDNFYHNAGPIRRLTGTHMADFADQEWDAWPPRRQRYDAAVYNTDQMAIEIAAAAEAVKKLEAGA